MAVFASCDTVSEDDRYIFVEPADAQRCVLIEEFTGSNCVNCPNGVKEIETLEKDYPGGIIAVGIHGGPLARAIKSDLGDEYYEAAGSPNQPAGRIDRRGGTNELTQWRGLVHEAIQRKPEVMLSITGCDYSETGEIDIEVEALGLEAVDGKLQLWLVEDGIVAMQFMPDGSRNREYVHNHVLRAAVNGTWGEDISLGKGETKTVCRKATVEDGWKAGNMSVVAFIYGDNGVMNVTKAHVTMAAAE